MKKCNLSLGQCVNRFGKLLNSKLFFYFLLVIVVYLSLSQMYHCIHIWYDREWIIHLRRLPDAMLLALPILFWKKRSIIFSWLILVDLYMLSIVWYFQTYGTIMPISSYLMINNLNGLFPCIWHAVQAEDFLIIFPSIIYAIIYTCFYKKIKNNIRLKLCVCIVALLIGTVAVSYYPNKRWLSPLYLYSVVQVKTFKEFGLINFWIYQIHFHRGVSAEEKEYAEDFVESLPGNICVTKPDSVNKDKNLILILVESMQSWPIGLTINGIEVTPEINALLRQVNTVYFPKEIPQVKDGRSSDAQLIINTGLLPLYQGAASGICTHNTFPSLAEALNENGYTTASFICDGKDFWNQEVMSANYQFKYLFDGMQKNVGIDKADETLFKSTLPLLKELQQPFYAQIVTLSSHSPYLRPLLKSALENCSFPNEEVKYYLIAIQYVDYCIGKFIRKLKSDGLYENSVVVITGDHEEMTFNHYEGRKELKAEDCFVPFIVLNSPLLSEHENKVIGQVDLYPSLLDLMGCRDYYFRGLGESVFNDKVSNYAMYRSGITAAGGEIPDSIKAYRKECWKVSDILLRMDYFGNLDK